MIYIIPQGPIMRYPAQHKQQMRQRIVRAALRRFRSRGTEGASIGTLMRALRLTHGGFYRHFRSKEFRCSPLRSLGFGIAVRLLGQFVVASAACAVRDIA